jgi:predicted thioesterase
MNQEAVSRIFFEKRHTVSRDETAQRMSASPSQECSRSEPTIGAMASGRLLAVLESLCLHEVQPFLIAGEETVIGHSLQLLHSGPIAAGAALKVIGWVESLDQHEVRMRIQACDEHEQVCEGTIHLTVVRRAELARRIERKAKAIARRELFLAA